MATDDKTIDEKVQYHINREAVKISPLSTWKIDKYDTYSPWEKAFEKQTKTTEKQGEKQIKAIENRVKKIF